MLGSVSSSLVRLRLGEKMTLVSAWIRDTGNSQQLIVASDSRLSFGARWDCCPKIFPLQRNDSVLAFCGDTDFAYPILLQLLNAVGNYEKVKSREMDITKLRPHFLKVIDSMRGQVADLPKGNHAIDNRDFKLLFAGYSSEQKQYKAWVFYYDKTKNTFSHTTRSFHRNKTGGKKGFLFIGDNVREARHRVYEKLKERNKFNVGVLDMEPLEVLTEMCEAQAHKSIGGPPQLVKIYAHANVLPINVLWPPKKPKYVAHFGRPLLDYENSRFACLDLNDFSLLAPYDAYRRIERQSPAAQ